MHELAPVMQAPERGRSPLRGGGHPGISVTRRDYTFVRLAQIMQQQIGIQIDCVIAECGAEQDRAAGVSLHVDRSRGSVSRVVAFVASDGAKQGLTLSTTAAARKWLRWREVAHEVR